LTLALLGDLVHLIVLFANVVDGLAESLLRDQFEILSHFVVGVLLLMLCHEVVDVVLVEVAEVSALLDDPRAAFNDEVHELRLAVSHVVLLHDDVLWQVHVHLHVLDEELDLGEIIVGGEETSAAHGGFEADHLDDVTLAVAD